MKNGLVRSALLSGVVLAVLCVRQSNAEDFVVTVRDLKTNAQQEGPVTVRVVDTESGEELVATRLVNTKGDTIKVPNADFKNLIGVSLRFEFRSPTNVLKPATLDRVMNVQLPIGDGKFAPQTLIVVMPEADVCPPSCECYPVRRRCGFFRR